MMVPLKIAVLLSGRGSNLKAILDSDLVKENMIEVVVVISDNPQAIGLNIALDYNIPVKTFDYQKFSSRSEVENNLMGVINSYRAQLVVCAGFMRVFTPYFTQYYLGRLINIHPSLLPKYKGLHTHKRVLESTDTEHGASVHFITEELDGGPIIMQTKVPLFASDTEELIATRVLQEEHFLYPTVLKLFVDKRVKLVEGKVEVDGEIISTPLLFSDFV